jgi:hypothetical protein
MTIAPVSFTSYLNINTGQNSSDEIIAQLIACDDHTFEEELNARIQTELNGGVTTVVADSNYLRKLCDTNALGFSQWIARLAQNSDRMSGSFHAEYGKALAVELGAQGFSTIASIITQAFDCLNYSCIRFYIVSYPASDPVLRLNWYTYLFTAQIIKRFFATGAWNQLADGYLGTSKWIIWFLSKPAPKQMVVNQVVNFWNTQQVSQLRSFFEVFYRISYQQLTFDERDGSLEAYERDYYVTANINNSAHQSLITQLIPDTTLVNQRDLIKTLPTDLKDWLYYLLAQNRSPFGLTLPASCTMVYELTGCNVRQLLVDFSRQIKVLCRGNALTASQMAVYWEMNPDYYAFFDELLGVEGNISLLLWIFKTLPSYSSFEKVADQLAFGMSCSQMTRTAQEQLEWERAVNFTQILARVYHPNRVIGEELQEWIHDYFYRHLSDLVKMLDEKPDTIKFYAADLGLPTKVEETFLGPLLFGLTDQELADHVKPMVADATGSWYQLIGGFLPLMDRIQALV